MKKNNYYFKQYIMEATKLKRIVIKEELYAITKDTLESIILGQFIYWEGKE